MCDDNSVNGHGRRSGRKRNLNEDNLTEDEKAKKQKNRDAAKKCRQRKLDQAQAMKQENEQLENDNRELTKKKSDLEAKIQQCLLIMEEHKKHGCHLPDNMEKMLRNGINLSDQSHDFRAGNKNDNIPVLIQQQERVPGSFRKNIVDSRNSESETPTGLFSGTHLQTEDKIRKLETSIPELTLPDDQLSTVNRLKNFDEFDGPNAYYSAENGEGQYQSSSPVQRVPNIDHMPWSPNSSRINDEGDSDEDEPLPVSIASSSQVENSQSSVMTSRIGHLSGGFFKDNAIIQQHSTNQNISQFTKPTSNEGNSASSWITNSLKNKVKSNESSFTLSMQATTELISQAITDIPPSEISKSLHAQIVECTQPSTANVPNIGEEEDYLIEDSREIQVGFQSQSECETKPPQQDNKLNSGGIINIPIDYRVIENMNVTTDSSILQGTPVSLASTQFTQFLVTTTTKGEQQLIALPYNPPCQVIPQPDPSAEDFVQESQIPTTVLNEEDEIGASLQNSNNNVIVNNNATSSVAGEGTGLPSLSYYNSVLSELPSLSFNDLQNQPKEIFEKKPSR